VTITNNIFITSVIFLLLLIIAILIYLDNNDLEVSQYTISSSKIPAAFNDFKILQLSDLHSKSFGKNNDKLIKKINGEKPAIIVMTGDMVSRGDTKYDNFINLAKKLSESYDTYYIVGNHEQSLSEDRQRFLLGKLKEIGVRVLDNEKVEIRKGCNSINLYGLWINMRYYKDVNNGYTKGVSLGTEQMEIILGNTAMDSYNVLLAHNPLYFETYSKWGADLTLSGHIHGGMIRLPFVGGLLSPERKFFPKYDAGRYAVKGKVLIVNRGLGVGKIGFRLFNRPEISVITLKSC
jgi:predicted MPP superfamily phosphohydrolase